MDLCGNISVGGLNKEKDSLPGRRESGLKRTVVAYNLLEQ
jgi:hypothetical protein